MKPAKLLSPEDLSDFLNIEIKTLYNWSSAGIGPRVIRVGGRLRYRPTDVEKWLDQRASEPSAAA